MVRGIYFRRFELCELNYTVRSTLGITVYYDLISTAVKIRFDSRELQVYIPIGTKSRMQYFIM